MTVLNRLRAAQVGYHLSLLRRLMPRALFAENALPRNSMPFQAYSRVLSRYARALGIFDHASPKTQRVVQSRLLNAVVHAARHTPWWRTYFDRHSYSTGGSVEQLAKLPPVNRFSLLDTPHEDLLVTKKEDPKIVWRRSGGSTTGTPFVWGLNKELLTLHVMARFAQAMEERGLPLETFIEDGAYVECNYPHASVRSEFKWFSLGDFYLKTPDDMDRLTALLSTQKHTVIRTIPIELRWFIGECSDRDMHPSVSFFSVTGQQLEPEIRALAKQYFGASVMVHYGAQEMGPLAIECPEHPDRYHIFPERSIIELLDEYGHPVPTGTEGNITVTVLDNTVMPLIRYQPGDIGVFHEDLSCSCAKYKPLLEIRSRATDVLYTGTKEVVSAVNVLRRFGREPFVSSVRRFQVRQDAAGAVTILLEERRPLPHKDIDALRERIRSAYSEALSIDIRIVSSIPNDGPKFKVFVPLKTPP